ncbi:thaumatin-like protein 1 isoform X2 [Prosopis cineraria]|uniref:thaumatin-like protein 1 isoform X2 n=1 Tax=Prosopis cineraria TaxID=364024 RepID=UPI0024102C46|nr:thaumatin-like protein 1 isoform X2 [Prosopis cineraria]
MEPLCFLSSCFTLFLVSSLLLHIPSVHATTFTFVNRCHYTVWPGILANAGSGSLDTTGFELPTDASRSFLAPTGWSGRFWARTGCHFDGSGTCVTGDCGSGELECNGAGASPPVTLAEFTLSSSTGGQDFYDVSLVDGYNVPMIVEGSGGSGLCASTGCVSDLNRQCPEELRAGEGDACKSACEAFNSPEYCCSGAYSSPATCRPSVYSAMFKSACPRSYSYAYDDATSTFTCTGADYTVTFCPSSPSQKSSQDYSPPMMTSTPTPPYSQGSGFGATSTVTGVTMGSGSDFGSDPKLASESGSNSDPTIGYTVTGSGSSGEAMLADSSYIAGLAMGASPTTLPLSSLQSAFVFIYSILLSFFLV